MKMAICKQAKVCRCRQGCPWARVHVPLESRRCVVTRAVPEVCEVAAVAGEEKRT